MSRSYIGSTLSVHVGTPASETETLYEGLSPWTEVGKVVSIGEIGDTSEDITFDLLKTGRRSRVSGVKDLGEIPISVEFPASDAGLTLIETHNNSNTTLSFRVSDADGEDVYFQALAANLRDMERTAGQYKGKSFVLRGQTGTTSGTT